MSGITLKALILDLDDTLVMDEIAAKTAFHKTCILAQNKYGIKAEDFETTIRRVCREIWYKSPARSYCVSIGISSWEGLWADFGESDRNLKTLQDWAPTYRLESWHKALTVHGIQSEEFAVELAFSYMKNRRKLHMAYDDVYPFLNKVRPHFRLGLLTNGVPNQQREKIQGAGIGRYFDEIVISGEVGIGKPSIQIFNIILSRLGVNSNNALMIGNSLKSDIQGAIQSGMHSAWLNRNNNPNDQSIVPELEINSLRILSRLLME